MFLPERRQESTPVAAAAPAPVFPAAARAPRPAVALAHQVASGVTPLMGEAHRVSNDALTEAPASAPQSARSPSASVQNTFNVDVHLSPDTGGAGLDRNALEQLLVEILRDAARRNGLEV